MRDMPEEDAGSIYDENVGDGLSNIDIGCGLSSCCHCVGIEGGENAFEVIDLQQSGLSKLVVVRLVQERNEASVITLE